MTDSAILRFNRDLLFELETDGTPEGSIVKAPFSGTIPGGGPILSFDSTIETPIPLIVDIKPAQEGTGDPSPSNVRAISGWDSVNIYVSPTTSTEDGTTTTINLPQTVYGGVLDVVSGKLTLTHKYWTENGLGAWQYTTSGGPRFYIGGVSTDAKNVSTNGWSNYGKLTDAFTDNGIVVGSNGRINLCGSVASAFADVNALKAALASTPLQVVYELAAPTEVTLTPTEVKTLIGPNNIWSNSGDVYTAISTENVTYKITGGAEDVQRFNKIWGSLLLYRNGGLADKYRNLFGEGDNIIPHDPPVLKED